MKPSSTPSLIPITTEMVGLRLDKALSLSPLIQSRSRAEYLIDKGLVKINGKGCKSAQKILASDIVEVHFPEVETSTLKPLPLALDILFEDADLIVLNKPSGLVVHPAAGHQQDTLVNALIHHTKNLSMKFGENRPGIVHRLDRDTSGLIVVAKNDFTHERLALQFKQKTNHRVYFAVGLGIPAAREGKIISYLARHPTERKKFASVRDLHNKIIRNENGNVVPAGKQSITNYTVLKTNPAGFSYFRLQLETGRTHQIRVHLHELGCSILGDEIYGGNRNLSKIKNLELRLRLLDFPRLALHAAELGFIHPRAGESLFFKQDWPLEIQQRLLDLNLR